VYWDKNVPLNKNKFGFAKMLRGYDATVFSKCSVKLGATFAGVWASCNRGFKANLDKLNRCGASTIKGSSLEVAELLNSGWLSQPPGSKRAHKV